MGFNASQFVVGDEWVHRLRDDAASERVRILGVMPKKRSAKVDVEFVDDPDGRVETVPGSRLRVLWSELESYEALMADWGRIASPVLDLWGFKTLFAPDGWFAMRLVHIR